MPMNRMHQHGGAPHAHDAVVRVLQAVSEPARLSLVHLLADGPQRVVDLTASLGLAQSTVSGHLAVLREAGLVTATPQGRAVYYALADDELDALLGAAERLVAHRAGTADVREAAS